MSTLSYKGSTLDLNKSSHRKKLPARREPYWVKVDKSLSIGFYKQPNCENWKARMWMPVTRGYKHYTISTVYGMPNFDDVRDAAVSWKNSLTNGGKADENTIQHICERYLNYLDKHKPTSLKRAEMTLRKYVFGSAFGALPTDPQHFTSYAYTLWRDGVLNSREQGEGQLQKISVNRITASVKAALNYGYKVGALSHRPWATPDNMQFRNAANRRELYLSAQQREQWIEACEPATQKFARALNITGARPGEVAKMKVYDVAPDGSRVRLLCGKKVDGEFIPRWIPVSPTNRAFFLECAEGRDVDDLLFKRHNGRPWHNRAGTGRWAGTLNTAATKVGLPDEAVAYTFRHSVLTDWTKSIAVPVALAASWGGTSVEMIEKHYLQGDNEVDASIMEAFEQGAMERAAISNLSG